jgi:hypothetical protein
MCNRHRVNAEQHELAQFYAVDPASRRVIRVTCLAMLPICILAACSEPTDRQPSQQQLDVFTNKLKADEKAHKDAAIADARAKEADKASNAEARLEDSANERRVEKVR